MQTTQATYRPGMRKIVTYALAYTRGTVSLCAKHAETYQYPLGPVSHGGHMGYCESCDSERGLSDR